MRLCRSPGACQLRARLPWSLAFLAFAFVVVGYGSTPAVARPIDEITASGVLRVIVYDDNAPFSWTADDGSIKGIDADIGRAIAARLGVKADIIARTAGEEADDDLRSNIWQGPRTGGLVGDVMMHVPMEKEFIARNNLVAISNAYHHEQTVLVVHPDMVDPEKGLAAFDSAKLAVQFATVAHYYAMFADAERYKANINPYRKFDAVAEAFLDRSNAGILGRRSEIEAALAGKAGDFRILHPKFETYMRMAWTIGTAVKFDSRDTGYEVGKAMAELRASGALERIFKAHCVTLVEPPAP